jgi:hypothetical protein
MRTLLSVLLLFCALPAFGQGTRVDVPAQYASGGVVIIIPNAPVTVCTATATGIPCSPTTQVYSDIALHNLITQPFTADAQGNIGFYVPTAGAPITYTINPNSFAPSGAGPFTLTPGGGQTFENIQYVDKTLSRGGADICDEINKAYTAGPSTGVAIQVAPTTQYTCTTPIVFGTAAKPIFLNCSPGAGAGNPTTSATTFINYTPTTGTAVTLNTGEGSRIVGCTFVGSGDSNSTIGLLPGGVNGFQEGDVSMTDISGFGVGIQFGNNTYVDRFSNDYIHDNGVNGTRNIYVPSGLSSFGENIKFSGGSVANKVSGFPTTCVEVDSGTDIHFDDISLDQCGVTTNGTNVFIDLDSHIENPNGATASPFFTFGTSCNFCTLTIKRGEWLEDGTTGSRTEFIKDISTVDNHDVEVFISGGAFVPNETVTQLVNSTGAVCCARATITGYQNGFGGALFTNAIGGNFGTGWNGTVTAQACGTTSSCTETPIVGPLQLKMTFGSVPLVSGTPSTATVSTFNPGFTSTSSYKCFLTNETTQTNSYKCTKNSGTSITITGPNTVTDVVDYFLVGN